MSRASLISHVWAGLVIAALATSSSVRAQVLEYVFSGACETDLDGREGSCDLLFGVGEGERVNGLLFLDESVVVAGDTIDLPFDDVRWDYLFTYDHLLSKSNQGFPTPLSITFSPDASTFEDMGFEASRGLAGGFFFDVTEDKIRGTGVVSPPFFSATATGGWQRREPVDGDFNADGGTTLVDMELLCRDVAVGGHTAVIDLDGDNVVDNGDVDVFLELANRFPGDADFNGEVQFPDLVVLSNHFGGPVPFQAGHWSSADFDCSGDIQFPDLTILANNYGQSVLGGVAVPEPIGLGPFVILSALILLRWRDR